MKKIFVISVIIGVGHAICMLGMSAVGEKSMLKQGI